MVAPQYSILKSVLEKDLFSGEARAIGPASTSIRPFAPGITQQRSTRWRLRAPEAIVPSRTSSADRFPRGQLNMPTVLACPCVYLLMAADFFAALGNTSTTPFIPASHCHQWRLSQPEFDDDFAQIHQSLP